MKRHAGLFAIALSTASLALSLPAAAAVQDAQRKVSGRLIDSDLGDPVPGAEVSVLGSDKVAITDAEGRFVLDVPSTPAVIIAQGGLIQTTRVDLKSLDEGTSPLIIRAPFVEDNSVMVVAERVAPLTASTREITAREFQAVPRRTAEDALQLVPGFTLVQHGSEGKGHQFFLRGFDAIHGSDLELSVEGVTVNEWSNIHAQGYLDVAFIIPETIESVEVTKGPFTLGQGAFAMAGSANYQLGIAPEQRGIRAAYTFGSTMRHRGVVTYSPKKGDGEDFVAGEILSDKGFGVNRGISRASLLGRWRLLQSPKIGKLTLMASAYTAKFELPGTLRYQDYLDKKVDFFDAYDEGANGRSQRAVLSLDHEYTRDRHKLNTTIYGMGRRLYLLENYTGFLIDPVNGDRRQQEQDAFSVSGQLNYDYKVTDGLGFQAGLGARTEFIDQVQDHVNMDGEKVDGERSLDATQSLANVYTGFRWRHKDKFWVAGGVRGDLMSIGITDRLDDSGDPENEGVRFALSPRVTLEYKISTPLRVFAAYGRGFRPPEARSFSGFVPSKKGIKDDVVAPGRPEFVRDDGVELGARWMPSRYFAVSAAAFGTFLKSETIFDHVSGVNLQLGGTRRLGGEMEVHSSPIDGLTLSADVTYVDARFVESGNKVPLSPWLTGSAKAVYTNPKGFRAGLYFMGIAPRPLPHDARGGSLATLDATAGYTWKWLSLDLELENALNSKVREGEYHYASHWDQDAEASEIPVIHFVAGAPINARLTLSGVF